MRFSEINEAAGRFYHGSKKAFPIGFILKPQPDGYVHGVYGDEGDIQIQRTEKALEQYRPQNMISRYDSVFLVSSPAIIEHAGGHSAFIYEVEPIGACEKNCLWWYQELENSVGFGNDMAPEEVETLSNNYWNGVPAPHGKISTFEFRCTSAKIIKILKRATPK